MGFGFNPSQTMWQACERVYFLAFAKLYSGEPDYMLQK